MWLLLACADDPSAPVALRVTADEAFAPALQAYGATLPFSAEVNGTAEGTWDVAVRQDLSCDECYALSGEGTTFTIDAGGVLGAQYGLTALLEEGGLRFLHPFDTVAPDALPTLGALDTGEIAPAIPTRSLHLHTLHPIEALDAMWMDEDPARAEAILDWVVRTRGDAVQWVALDDITDDPEDWQARTRVINDAAHVRGLTTGLGVQLYGSSNLQHAFDLLDESGSIEENRVAIEDRLSVVTGVGFDHLSLSFGEFFGADPDDFLADVDLVREAALALDPDLTLSTTIHVGADQTVTFQGEEMIYYFLAQFADPAFVPWVHSVMYYDLYEDAGGAYGHEEFDAHRAFLEERVASGEPVGYHPESAYWVAFDDSVPTYLPLYLRSRWLDLDTLSGVGTLPAHVLFSTGWEWGYWQNDYVTMRLTHTLRPWEDEVRDIYAPWGADGAALADVVIGVAGVEHAALLEGRLAAYVAGRDAVMDVGYAAGVVSQPERPSFADVAAWTAEEKAAFAQDVVARLDALAADLSPYEADAAALPDDPWLDEVADGVAITRLRVAYAAALWGAVAGDEARLADADALLVEAEAVVTRRAGAFHDPLGATWLLDEWENPTVYPWGYLRYANDLCYWRRDRVQAQRATIGTEEEAPTCI